jgi:hypothetical protein
LAEDRFFNTYPCIIITGKGEADLATRQVVLSEWLELEFTGAANPPLLIIVVAFSVITGLQVYWV